MDDIKWDEHRTRHGEVSIVPYLNLYADVGVLSKAKCLQNPTELSLGTDTLGSISLCQPNIQYYLTYWGHLRHPQRICRCFMAHTQFDNPCCSGGQASHMGTLCSLYCTRYLCLHGWNESAKRTRHSWTVSRYYWARFRTCLRSFTLCNCILKYTYMYIIEILNKLFIRNITL